MLSNISRDILDKEHPSFDENRKRAFCLGFLGGFNYSEKNPDANRETIDSVSRDSMNRSNPWSEEYEKETYLLGFNRGYSYVANDEARHYRQYMENPFSDQIGLGEATPDYDSADAAGLGVQFPILLKGTIIGWLPVDAIYDKDKPNHLISDDSHYLRMSSVGDSAEIKKEYRGQGYGKAAYYELAVKAARMGMVLCSAPDSSRSENANRLWKSLVSSGYARQNGDRYEFINSKIIVTNKAVGGGIQTASKNMTKLEEMAFSAAKPHGYDPAAKQVFQDGYVKGANTMLESVEEILDRNKQAYNYSKDYYINIDVFKQRIDELKDRKPAVSKEAPEKAFKDGYVEGANAILDEVKEILNENKQVFKYNKESYVNIDVFTEMIDELKDKKPAISEEAASEKALKPDNRFSDEMQEAKAKLFDTIMEAKKDMGDEISIAPTEISENGDKYVITEILPDFESPFEDQNIIGGVSHSDDEGCVHNLALCLENVNDAEALEKAVHEAHVKHLEQDAKQAIRDRIVTPSARRFTPDQIEHLKIYAGLFPDTPAGELFTKLYEDVIKDPDVARKPEKWQADTLKELEDIAQGKVHEEAQQLKK